MSYLSSEYHPQPNRSRIPRGLRTALGITAAAVLLPAAIWGLAKISEESAEGTHFADAAAAVATLRADAAAHRYDEDCFGPDQGRMEKDLRGANPLTMKVLGQKIVDAAAHPQHVELKDGRTLDVTSSVLDDGRRADTIEIAKNDVTKDTTRLWMTVNPDGSFDKLTFDEGGTDMSSPSNVIGGAHFEYGFPGNDFEDSNTAQYADGRPLTDLPGGAIIVNNTYFSTYTAAGPAIETVVEDYDNAIQAANTGLNL